jgi:hypothetical protein
MAGNEDTVDEPRSGFLCDRLASSFTETFQTAGDCFIYSGTARSTSDIVVYSDASGREGHLGAAVVVLDSDLETVESQ